MSVRIRRALWGCLLFSAFGLCVEIAFTGLSAGRAQSFRGEVSLLMVPVYSTAFLAIGPLLGLAGRFGLQRPVLRIPLTVVAIYAVEWSFGAGYAALGLAPWYYDHGWASDWSRGFVTLRYLPAWIGFAVIVVPVWRRVEKASRILAA